MPEVRRPPRAPLRALLVLAIVGTTVFGVPVDRSSAAPEAVVRTVPIDAARLVRPGLTLAPGGALRSTASARTRAVTTCAPIWFDGLAFTWRQARGRSPVLRVATGDARDAVGAAVDLGVEGGADPGTVEARSAAIGSDYLWTGGARCVRVRLHLSGPTSIGSLRAVFLNTSGTAAGPGTGPPEAGPSLGGGPATPVASAATRRPRIISRERWGANPKLMNCTPDVAPFLSTGFVHHTAGTNHYTRREADDVVRGVYAYHTQVRGWCDIGYNFLVDRYGDVFEGRSGGVTNDVIGAAQMGFNTGAFSVSVMGTFSTVAPPRAAVRAVERLLAWRLDVAHVNPLAWTRMTSAGGSTTKYDRGTTVRLHTISGHRDTGLTDCPGGRLYALLPRIRRAAARIGLPKFFLPRLSADRLVAGEPADLRVRARGSTTLSWSVSILDPAGSTIADLDDRGDRLDVRWKGTIEAPGRYRVVIAASSAKGTPARPAELPLTVRSAALGPTPSPTASPIA